MSPRFPSSLTTHAANNHPGPQPSASEGALADRSSAPKPGSFAAATIRVAKALAILISIVVVIGAIVVFKLWMWWPRGVN